MNIPPFPGFESFPTHHCVTGSLRHIYEFYGYPISEEMLLGLGEGVGYMYWHQKGAPPVEDERLHEVAEQFHNLGHRWQEVARLLKAAAEGDPYALIIPATEPLDTIADLEQIAWERLREIVRDRPKSIMHALPNNVVVDDRPKAVAHRKPTSVLVV